MNCICCGSPNNIVDSHVISKFIRMAITGVKTSNGKKFDFQWCGRRGLPRQDLPKPKLLCSTCDNRFGQTIEGPASKILLPNGDMGSQNVWESLPYSKTTMPFQIAGKDFKVGEYQIDRDDHDCALRKFSVLTAWRALHAMGVSGDIDAVNFLASVNGKKVQDETVSFLNKVGSETYLHFPYHALLYFLGPNHAATITGKKDEVPFAWTFLQSDNQSGIAVILGFWVIVWPLLPDGDPRRNAHELLRLTFVDWHAHVMQQLHKGRPA